MAERMRFILDGDDRLTPVLNGAGDSAARLNRRIDGAMNGSSNSVRVFTRDANGRLRDLNGHFISVASAARLIQDSNGRWRDLNGRFVTAEVAARRMRAVTSDLPNTLNRTGDAARRAGGDLRRLTDDTDDAATAVRGFTRDANGRLRDLNGRFVTGAGGANQLGAAASSAAGKLGGSGGGLGGAMMGVAAIAGLSLLPALGALAPMMVGAGVAAGTLSLGFKGVGEAAALAGEDKKKYKEALKKLSPEARAFTKELVGLKKQFGGLGKDIQKAMLPGFTAAVKDAAPFVKLLGRGMTEMGKGFGEAARGVGRLLKDSGFQKDFSENMRLGGVFVRDLTRGLGGLVRGFLDFGAASEPTLKALSGGISDLLGKGLTGMFEGLKRGIEGSAKFLTGFFSMINTLLPAIGRFSGEVARTFGPLLGELFTASGKHMAGVLDLVGAGLRLMIPLFKDLGYGVKAVSDVFSILMPTIKDTGKAIVGSLLPSFSQIDSAVGPLQRLSRWVQDNKIGIQEWGRIGANAILDFVSFGVEHLPHLVQGFRYLATGALTALDAIISGAAATFGWIPGIGDKLKSANREFDKFKNGFITGLHDAEGKTRAFAASVAPKLAQNKLKMNIANWESQIATAKGQLKTVPPEKRAKLLAHIKDLEAKAARARGELASIKSKSVTVTMNLVNSGLNRTRIVNGVAVRAKGGVVRGPGTSTSDSIPALLSDGEFVIRAKSVARYGMAFLEAINAGRMGMSAATSTATAAAGGGSGGLSGAGREAGAGLASGLGASLSMVQAAARTMAAAVTLGVRRELEIASPSRKMQALGRETGKGLIAGLTGTRSKIAATAKHLAASITAAFKGTGSRKDDRLVALVGRTNTRLQSLAAQRDKIAAKIAQAGQLAIDVTKQSLGTASLSSLGEDSLTGGVGGLRAALAGKLAQIQQFSRYIATLKKKGLSRELLRQLVEMGPEQGFSYASTLAGAGSGMIIELNKLQAEIGVSSSNLGKISADALFDAGKQAGKGFLTGLAAEKKRIEALMLSIAKGMQAAIRKALGIRSPSRVMAQLGRHSTEGLAMGLIQRLPVLDSALGTVAGRFAATRPAIGLPAGTGHGGGQQVIVKIDVHGAMDPIAVGREIRRILLELKRTQGVNLNLGVG